MKKILPLIGVIVISGCSSVLAPQKTLHIKSEAIGTDGDLYSVPVNLRTIDVRKKNADYIVCSEPVPDVATSNALKLALEASDTQSAITATTTGDDSTSGNVSKALGLKGSYDASTTALELAGRTQIVLLAREFLSSNCKARANGWISDTEFGASQRKIVEQITIMIRTDNKKAIADEAKATAVGAAVKAQLDEKALANVTDTIRQVKGHYCLTVYDECVESAEKDALKGEKCEIDFIECNN